MKTPNQLSPLLFAPCGVNCMVCYRHLKRRAPCAGCRADDGERPAHCRNCAIRECLSVKGHSLCLECGDFPCKAIRNLDKSYRHRYQASVIENSRRVGEQGAAAFLEEERSRFSCESCGGILSLQDRRCSECGKSATAEKE